MKILIIQTAFIGDVILATPVVEKLSGRYPDAEIHFLLRKGNEGLLENHPKLKSVLIWNRKENKYKNLLNLLKQVRSEKFDIVVNMQRFFSSGLLTAFSKSPVRIGFSKNPLSFLFTKTVEHVIGGGKHEVERNLELINSLVGEGFEKPKLYPSKLDFENVNKYKNQKYICIAPTSVWFTKQFPKNKWIELIKILPDNIIIYLLGATSDSAICEEIKNKFSNNIINLTGKLSFLESAALMTDAQMNFVNDSAPMHIASAMNAPTTAIFCSTIPDFGFGPLSEKSKVIEVSEKLNCRPCGLHGKKACPESHFKCANDIDVREMLYFI